MLSIYIGYGKKDSQWLTLTASRAEAYETLGKIMEARGWEPTRDKPFIRAATSEILNLPGYLEGYIYSVPETMNQLNFLAARVAWMDTRQRGIFSEALENMEPECLWQLIEMTYNLDQFEKTSDTIRPEADKQWNHVLIDENFYKNPFGRDIAFFLHVHTGSGPGKSSFALRLPQKEKIWDRFETWVGTDKPSEVKTVQCGGLFGELWEYIPANCTWKEADDFADYLMDQEIKNPDVFIKALIRRLEAGRPCSMDEVYQAADSMNGGTEVSNAYQIRLFSPLEGEFFAYNERGKLRLDGYQLNSRDLVQYQQSIAEAMKNEDWLQRHPCGFAEQLENKLLRQRVISMIPMTKEWGGRLWGVLEVKSHEKLLPEEINQVITQWKGIAAAGWEHQNRNMGIKTEEGELHLGFWNNSPDFCILTEAQLKENGMKEEENYTQEFRMG